MAELAVSPLAPDEFPQLPPVGGVRLATVAAGLRYEGRDDILLVELAEGTTVAGTFTRSLCPSAPVDWCRTNLPAGTARALVVNAGNANAFTGAQGAEAVVATAEGVGAALGIERTDVYAASTGVIGEQLSADAILAEIPGLVAALADADSGMWSQAAGAIRTTDTYPKGAGAAVSLVDPATGQSTDVAIAGIAKGSGMIAPDMATMLSFVFCDAAVSADVAQWLISRSVDGSYNRITVDSDTSTSDTALLFCTGASSQSPIDSISDPRVEPLAAVIDQVNLDLAHQIVRDGEGATKFVEITVDGAENAKAAEIIALAIANSPLVKTALAAEDANWGRVVMAVGKSGQRADRDALAIWIGDEQVSAAGVVLDTYSEERATAHLRNPDVRIRADVGVGDGSATVWTCDLTHGYIDINAGYRS